MGVLKGNTSFYDFELSDTLSHNVKSWLEYGLLELGAYTRVTFDSPTSGNTNLKRVHDDRYGRNRVFEGMGPSWVWETDVANQSKYGSIFPVSGVYVNGSFISSTLGEELNLADLTIDELIALNLDDTGLQGLGITPNASGYVVDYRTGRVIFLHDVPSTNKISCEYVFRDIMVYLSDEPQWKTLIKEYSKNFDKLEQLSPSGMAMTLKENRVWLPAVVIEAQDRTNDPLQLGGGEIANLEMFYHVYAEQPFVNNRLCDVISNQQYKVLNLFNVNVAPQTYNFDGTLNGTPPTYKSLSNRSSPYFWTFGYIGQSDGGPRSSRSLFRSELRQTISVDRYLSTY